MVSTTPTLSLTGPVSVRAIYDQYAGMLYGYIFEVVKDSKLAESYLLMVFNELPQYLQGISQPVGNIYYKLQQLARKTLSEVVGQERNINNAVEFHDAIPARPNRFLQKMSDEQKYVFCNIHYYGKTVSKVARDMNTSEEEVRKVLQRAFAIIRTA